MGGGPVRGVSGSCTGGNGDGDVIGVAANDLGSCLGVEVNDILRTCGDETVLRTVFGGSLRNVDVFLDVGDCILDELGVGEELEGSSDVA